MMFLHRLVRGSLVSILAVSLVSCANQPAKDAGISSATLSNFAVSGGLGIWTTTENISSRMRWQQRGDDFTFDLTAPLGLASIKLAHQNHSTTVSRGDVVVARSANPGVALQQALGLAIPVPVSQIAQWLKGQPGSASATQYNDAGLLRSLQYTDQSGTRWDAVVRDRTSFQGARVPSLITASGGPYQVRIVLKEWQALSDEPSPETSKTTNNRLSIPAQ